MNRMRAIGSSKTSDTIDSRTPCEMTLLSSRINDLLARYYRVLISQVASTNRCGPKFCDHVNFDTRAEGHLRHTDGTARVDALLAEHLDK